MPDIVRKGIITTIETIFKDHGVTDAESKLNSFQTKVGQTTEGVNSKLLGLGEKLSKYYNVVVIAAVAGAIAKLADLAKAEDLAKTKFESLIGSSRKANELVDALDSLAIAANQSGDELQQAAFSMLKFGTAAKDIPNQLKTLSAVSAATGVSVGALAEQFGRINFKGFAIGRELKVIEKEGIPIFQALSKETGKSVEQLRKLAKVSSEDVNKALDSLVVSGGAFAGILEKQINSLDALQNRTKSAFDDIKETVGNAFLPGVKAVYQNLIPALVKVKEFLEPIVGFFAPTFQSAIQIGITAIGTAFDIVLIPVKALGSLLNDISATLFGLDFSKLNEIDKADDRQFSKGLSRLEAFRANAIGLNYVIQALGENISNSFERRFIALEIVALKLGNTLAKLAGLSFSDQNIKDLEAKLARIKDVSLKMAYEIGAATERDGILAEKAALLAAKEAEIEDEAAKAAIERRKKLYDELLKLQIQFRENERKVALEGLFSPESLKSDSDIAKLQDVLSKRVIEIQQKVIDAKKLGVKLPIGFEVDSEQQKALLITTIERLNDFNLIKSIPIKITPVVSSDPDVIKKLQLDIQKVYDDAAGDPDKLDGPKKKSFLSRLFGDDKEVQKEGEKALIEAGNNIKSALNQFFDAEIAKTDFLIEQQKKRIDEVNKIAALGNAEQLQIEEERLRKLEERREQSVKRQNAINAVQIVAQTALAVSSYATAIAKAAAEEHPLLAIAEGVALLAAIAAGVTQVRALSQGFYEGTEYVDQKGNHRSGIDTVPSMLTRGERVMTVQQNEALGGLTNPEVVQLVQAAKRQQFTGSSIYLDSNKIFANDFHAKKTNELLILQNEKIDRNTETMKNTFVDIRFDESGYHLHQRKLSQQAKKRAKIYR